MNAFFSIQNPVLDSKLVGATIIQRHEGNMDEQFQIGTIKCHYTVGTSQHDAGYNYEILFKTAGGAQNIALDSRLYDSSLDKVGKWALLLSSAPIARKNTGAKRLKN